MTESEKDPLERLFAIKPLIDEPAANKKVQLNMRMPYILSRELEATQQILGANSRADVIGRSVHWISWGARLAAEGYSIDIKDSAGKVVDSISVEEFRRAWFLDEETGKPLSNNSQE